MTWTDFDGDETANLGRSTTPLDDRKRNVKPHSCRNDSAGRRIESR